MKNPTFSALTAKTLIVALTTAAFSALLAGCADGPVSANSGGPASVGADSTTQDTSEAPSGSNSSLEPTVDPTGAPPEMSIIPR